MLFFNFLCLLYLMVYSNGHTISKNIDKDEETYEVFDTIANLDSNKHHRNRHNRIHQNYDRNDQNTKPLDVSESDILPEYVTSAYEALNNLNLTREDNIYNDKRTANKRNAVGPGNKAREKKHFKNKDRGLWARFTGNHRNTEPNNTTPFILQPPETLKKIKQVKIQKEKNKNAYGDSLYATYDVNNTTDGLDNVFVTIELIGTELNKLKDLYSGNNLGDKSIPFVSTDFPKTAEIEELLTSIKMKSIETIIENDPGVIEVISNSVTETTYTTCMDKLVASGASTPYADYAEGNLFQDISVTKRPEDPKDEINNIKSDMESYESHKRTKKSAARSVTHKCSPLEKFESDVRRIYNKMKSKVCRKTQMNTLIKTSMKETQKAKSQSTKSAKKLKDKTSVNFNYLYAASPNATSPIPPKQHKLKSNLNKAKHSQRSVKQEKNKLSKNVTTDAGYYKTYEQNTQSLQSFDLLTMIATTPKSYIENKHKHCKSTNKRPMTLRNHERSEALNEINKSDFELSDPFNLFNVSERLSRKAVYTDLSKKISYNDYVNGYKHYLKFQQDLGKDDDNFSPMVKYQAHRHHKVDDIGKFILDKIPQLTTCDDKIIRNLQRQKRNFVDREQIDDKPAIKTESDWINKHILFLLDKHPKKFHTSQIVPFKSPVNNIGSERLITKMYKKHQDDYINDYSSADSVDPILDSDLTTKIDLDALSKSLHGFENRSIDYAVTNIPEPEISRQECKACNGQDEPPIQISTNAVQTPIRQMRSLQFKPNKSNSSVAASETVDKNKIENGTKYTNPTKTLLAVKQAPHKEVKKQHKKCYRNMHTPTLSTVVVGRNSNRTSKSKFRGLFRKFHLNSKNHEKKYKRAGSTRLDPIKRLKNIFKMGQDRNKADRFQLPDTLQESKTTTEMTDTDQSKPSKSTRPVTKSPKKIKQSLEANITDSTKNYETVTNINKSLIHSPITFKKNSKGEFDKSTRLSDIDKNIQRLSDLIKNSDRSSPVTNKKDQKSSTKSVTKKSKSKNKSKSKGKTIQCIDISKILQHSESQTTESSTRKNKKGHGTTKANNNTTPHKDKMIQFIPRKSLNNKTNDNKTYTLKSLLHSSSLNANIQSFTTTNKNIEHPPNKHKNIEHPPKLNEYKDHSPDLNKYNEHSPDLNKYIEHSPNLNKYNEHSPDLNKINKNVPNFKKFSEHTPSINKHNGLTPNLNKYNEHTPRINKYNESPNLNKYNEHSPNINKYNEHSPSINKYNEHSPNINKYNEHTPSINKYNEHSPNINKYNEVSPNINRNNEHSTNINRYSEQSTEGNKYIEKSFDVNKYIEQSLGINNNIEHLPEVSKNIVHLPEVSQNTDHSSKTNKNVEDTEINKIYDHLSQIDHNIEPTTNIDSNFKNMSDEFNTSDPWINIDENNKYAHALCKNMSVKKEKNCYIPNLDKHVKYKSDQVVKVPQDINKHIKCESGFLKNIKHLPDYIKNKVSKEEQNDYDLTSSSSSIDFNKYNNDDAEFLKTIEHALSFNKTVFHGPSKVEEPVPEFLETTEDDAELLQEIEDSLHLSIKNQHGSTPMENTKPKTSFTFNNFTQGGSDLLKAMELVLNINNNIRNASEAINRNYISTENTLYESGVHTKNLNSQYINKKVHRFSEAINDNQNELSSVNTKNTTIEESDFERTINENIHRGTAAMKKTAHDASQLIKNVVHPTTKSKGKKNNYNHSERTHSKHNKNFKIKNKKIQDESELHNDVLDKPYSNKILKLEAANNLHRHIPNALHLHKMFTMKKVINTESPSNVVTKAKASQPSKSKKINQQKNIKADLKTNSGADNLVTSEYFSESSDLIEPLPVFPDHTTQKYENFASIFNEPDVHDPSVLRDMLPYGFRTTKKDLFYKKLKGALHLHQDNSKQFHTELDNVFPTEKSLPFLTEEDMYFTEKSSSFTERNMYSSEKSLPSFTEKYLYPTEKSSPYLTEKDMFSAEKSYSLFSENDIDYGQKESNAFSSQMLRVNRKDLKKNREPNLKKKNKKKLKKPLTTVTKPFKIKQETLPDLNLEIARMQNALAKKYGTATTMYNRNPVFTAVMTLMGGHNIGGTNIGGINDKIYKRHLTKIDNSDGNEAEGFDQTSDFETKDTPALMVDSTLLSYDGEVETVINGVQLNQVKKSEIKEKESTMSSKVKNVMLQKSNIAKIITTKAQERPEMYYSTPLPMKSEDFARFLKDQGMDVASVTSPLHDLLPGGTILNQRKSTTKQITDGLKNKGKKGKRNRENGGHWYSAEDERVIVLDNKTYDEVEEEKSNSEKENSKEDSSDTSDAAYDSKFLPTFEPKFDSLNPKVKMNPRWHTNETSLLNNFGTEFFNIQYNSTEPMKEITDEEMSQLEEKPTTKLTQESYHPDIPTRRKPLHNALLYNRTTKYVLPAASSSRPGTKRPSSTKINTTAPESNLFGDNVEWPQLLNPEEVHISSHHYDVDISFKKHLPKPITESAFPEINYESTENDLENEKDANFQELTEKPKFKKDIMKTKRPHSNGIRAAVKRHRKRSYLKVLPHNMKYFPNEVVNKKPEEVENTISSPVSILGAEYTTTEAPSRLLRKNAYPWDMWRDLIKYKVDPMNAYKQSCMEQQNRDTQYDILDAFKFVVKEPEYDLCHRNKGFHHHHQAFDDDREAPHHQYKYYNKEDDDKRFVEDVNELNSQQRYMNKYRPSSKATELFSLVPQIMSTKQKSKPTTIAATMGSTTVDYIAKQAKGHKTVIVPVSKSLKTLGVTDTMNDDENGLVAIKSTKFDTDGSTVDDNVPIDEKIIDMNVAEIEDDELETNDDQLESSLVNSLESKNQKHIETEKNKHNLQIKLNAHETPTKSTQTLTTTLLKSDTTSKQHTTQKVLNTNTRRRLHFKRNAETQSTCIAKDVAALEVVVDLMKNTGDEEKEIGSVPSAPTYYTLRNDATNAIQLHIVVPCDMDTGLKRSIGPTRIRKIFSAKMSTPVDLEYQVHSVEESPMFELLTTTPATRGLSPGMYLLLSKPNDGYALKPVRVQNRTSTVTTKENVIENTARLKLSKDFVEAVSNKIEELFDNLNIVNKSQVEPRKRRQTVSAPITANRKCSNKKKPKGLSQLIKKYFGYDNICNCKCVAGRPMCRECAASNAVIEELITEFDNIVKYMTDHCTEIQTYFWMNPSGGLKLRDAVDKVSKNLHAYYKRTKGKCKGKPCNSLANHIDKRQFDRTLEADQNQTNKINLDAADTSNETFESDLECNEKGEKMAHEISSNVTTRCDTEMRKNKIIKNVYSRDNININLICNSDDPSINSLESTVPLTENPTTSYSNDYDYKVSDSKPTRFKSLFWNNIMIREKDKPILSKKSFKRDAVRVNASSAANNSDIIWIDTKPSSNNEYNIIRRVVKRLQPKPVTKNLNTEPETVTDYFSQNINKVLDLFQNLQDVESSVSNSNGSSLIQTSQALLPEDMSLVTPITHQETFADEMTEPSKSNCKSETCSISKLASKIASKVASKFTIKTTTLTTKFSLLKTIKDTFCPSTKLKSLVSANNITTVVSQSTTLADKPATTANTTAKSAVTRAKSTKSLSTTSKSTNVPSTNKTTASVHKTSKALASVSKSKATTTSSSKATTTTQTASKSNKTALINKPLPNVPAISSLRTLLPNTSNNVIETYYIIYPESDSDSAYPDNLYSDIIVPVSDNTFKRSTGLTQNSLDDIHQQIDAISFEIQSLQQNTAVPVEYETKMETDGKQNESERKLTETVMDRNERQNELIETESNTNSGLNQNDPLHNLTETVHKDLNSKLNKNESEHNLTEAENMLTETKQKYSNSTLSQNEFEHNLTESAEHNLTEAENKLAETKQKITEAEHKDSNSDPNQNEPEHKLTEVEYKLAETKHKLTEAEHKLSETEHKLTETEHKEHNREMDHNVPEHKLTEAEYKQSKSEPNHNDPGNKLIDTEYKQTEPSELNQNDTDSEINQNKLTETEHKEIKSELNQNESKYKQTEVIRKESDSEVTQNDSENKLTKTEHKETKSELTQNESKHKLIEIEQKLAETVHKLTEAQNKLAETEHRLNETEHKLTESKLNKNSFEPNENTNGLIQAENDLNQSEGELNETDTLLRAHSYTRPHLYHLKTTPNLYPTAWLTQSFWVRLNAESKPITTAHTTPEPEKKIYNLTAHTTSKPKKKIYNLKITQSPENSAKTQDTNKNIKTSNFTEVILKFLGKPHDTDKKKHNKNTNPFKTTNSTETTLLEHENKIFEEVKITKSIDEAKKVTDGILSLKNPTLGTDDYYDLKNNTEHDPTVADVNGLDLLNDSLKMMNNSDNNESKKLLLSIIEYEMSKLHDEWQSIANVESDNEFKRSVTHTSNDARQSLSTIRQEANTTKQFEQSSTERSGLLNKLFGIKAKRKAAHSASTCASTNALSTHVAVENTTASCRRHNTSLSNWPDKQKISREQKRKIKIDEARLFCPSRTAVCDLQATFNYVAELRDQVNQKTFEKYVKEVPCHKYKRLKRGFLIHHKTSGLKWNWIRSKRSLSRFVKHQNVDSGDDQTCSTFEKFVKDADGIYRLMDREKRSTGKSLDYKLRDFRPLKIAKDELYVMAGDSVVLECPLEPPHIAYTEYSWEADPGDLIDYGNVEVNGPTLDIKKVAPRNTGRYSCSVDGVIRKSNVVTVVSLPTVDVVFAPTYKTQRDCTYDDLRAIQQLGREMSKAAGCGDICSIRIDEPVCQRDKVTNKSVIKSTGVLTMSARHLECSVMCRRDTFASLVRLALADIPVMENSKVILSKDNVNETLVPYFVVSKLVTTHTLRKKDSSGHFEYRKSKMLPGRVKPVIICGGGYYFVDHSGICVPCPSKTRSSAGDNTCTACPAGTSSPRGATECHDVLKRPRRYDWWWYPPCGYVVALSILVCACGVFLGLALVIHLVSRVSTERMSSINQDKAYNKRAQMTAACMQSSRKRHVSPSRVILARFFKYSMSSSKGTIVDSQETRFERWKEKNIPPSLPTIDFDLES